MSPVEFEAPQWAAIAVPRILTLFPSAFFPVVLVLLLALLAMILWMTWQRRHSSPSTSRPGEPAMTETTTVVARPLLTREEARLFNLIQLVVRDTYLVFGKLPLVALVNVTDEDDVTRRTILRTIRPVRADVVLAHPGTLRPVKAIFFSPLDMRDRREPDNARLVEAVLKAAGIERLSLDPSAAWTVSGLADTLGVQEES